MSQARRLSGENFGNTVSYRVAICRKRLRASRTTPRLQSSPGSGINLISTASIEGRTLNFPGNSPSVASELTTRPLLSRQAELATNPGGGSLSEAAVTTVVELGSATPEKAEDT